MLFFLTMVFISFKNETKVLKDQVYKLKTEYSDSNQIFLNREIQLSKLINQFQIDNNQVNFVKNNKILKFDREGLKDFTLIQVNYDQRQ
jgi:proteasome assembly chaperone (PAC2) family protein